MITMQERVKITLRSGCGTHNGITTHIYKTIETVITLPDEVANLITKDDSVVDKIEVK